VELAGFHLELRLLVLGASQLHLSRFTTLLSYEFPLFFNLLTLQLQLGHLDLPIDIDGLGLLQLAFGEAKLLSGLLELRPQALDVVGLLR